MWTKQNLEAYVLEAVTTAKRIELPFPHIIAQEFWPPDFYADLVYSLYEQHLTFVQRGAFGAGKTTMAQLLGAQHQSWYWVEEVLQGAAFQQVLHEVLGLVEWHDTYSRFLLHKDMDGYMIAPHLDTPSKRITYLCYFARDVWHSLLGTMLLQPKAGAWLQNLRSGHQFWYDFEVKGDVLYLPNTFCAFVPGPTSWHAVDVRFAHDDPEQARYVIRGFVFDPRYPLPYIFAEDAKERGLLQWDGYRRAAIS